MPTAAMRKRADREPMFRIARESNPTMAKTGSRVEDTEFYLAAPRADDEREAWHQATKSLMDDGVVDPARLVPRNYRAPAHIGMRRFATVDPKAPMDEWFYEPMDDSGAA